MKHRGRAITRCSTRRTLLLRLLVKRRWTTRASACGRSSDGSRCSRSALESAWLEPFKEFKANLDGLLANRRDMVAGSSIHRRLRWPDDVSLEHRQPPAPPAPRSHHDERSSVTLRHPNRSRMHERAPSSGGAARRVRAAESSKAEGRAIRTGAARSVSDDFYHRVAAQARHRVRPALRGAHARQTRRADELTALAREIRTG